MDEIGRKMSMSMAHSQMEHFSVLHRLQRLLLNEKVYQPPYSSLQSVLPDLWVC